MSSAILSHLGELSIETFLAEYWHKKPLLVRGALPDCPAIDPDRLAGFALEAEVESRLVLETPQQNDPLASAWQVRHGPFSETDFTDLPPSHWTLLVQAVDQLDPSLHNLLRRFRFLPNWRVDDLMVSYAVDQGSVGPHFDYYDVFLLQAAGRRRWHIGQTCSSTTELRDDVEQKLLREFATTTIFDTEPGDLLYLPPNVAHWGVAQGESLTYSVGFRAPSVAELLTEFADHLAGHLTEDHRLADPDLATRENPGLVTAADLARVRAALHQALADDTALADWFARYMTEPKRHSLSFEPQGPYCLPPDVRAAYLAQGTRAALYLNGEAFITSLGLAQRLCDARCVNVQDYGTEDRATLAQLQAEGWLS